ncbi:MAG: response regulator transcription factor [Acidobacteriota bacterium]
MDARHILVIEDELELARLVELHLKDWGCEVTLCHDGTDGLERAMRGDVDLIVLDWMLPGVDGLEICRRVRQEEGYVPILMLTARTAEIDRVLGLEVGADDYLTKPFSPRELVARVKAIFRRIEALGKQTPQTHLLKVGDLMIDSARRRVTLSGRPLGLTAKEFDLLAQFARHPGRVYSRAELLDLVWGYGHDGYEHTVNSHINRLRSKIEIDPGNPLYILTVWGIGYKLREPGDETGTAGVS